MKFTEAEEDLFSDILGYSSKHAKSGNVPFDEVVEGMICHSVDSDDPVGIILDKSKDPKNLLKYDSYHFFDENDEIDFNDSWEGFVAVKVLEDVTGYSSKEHNDIFLYGGDDPTAVVCKY